MSIVDALNQSPDGSQESRPDYRDYLRNKPQFPNPVSLPGVDQNMAVPSPEFDINSLSPEDKRVFKRNAMELMADELQYKAINPHAFGKEMPFSADMDHHKFERYYAHPDFDDLKFSPFRDNEALYNKNSSFWDELGRASGQWANLVSLGFKDAMGFGSLTDEKTAREYQRAMNIGQSSKGGFTGFTTNLYLNSGYTVGIMGEILAEELLMSAVTGPGGTLKTAAKIPGAFRKIYEGVRTGNKILNQLDNLKDINKARTSFQNMGGRFLNFMNPAGETTKFIKNFNNINKAERTALGFASFYRDMRNIRLAWSESGLEGGMVKNDVYDELMADFEATHDRPPTGAEIESMKNTADAAGLTTGWQNLFTIYFSNKLVFDNMFKAMSPFGKLMDDVVMKNAGGRIAVKGAKASKKFAVEESGGVKNFLKRYTKPKEYLKAGGSYFTANFAEGLQEVAQEAISGAATDYYTNQYKGTPVRGGYYAAIADNLQKQVSPEGLETFASGFLMGGMVSPLSGVVGKTPSYLKSTYSRFKDPAAYKKAKADKVKELNDMVNTLNDVYKDPSKYFNIDVENIVTQEEIKKQLASGKLDELAARDITDASTRQAIYTVLQTGKLDTFLQRIAELKGLSKEDVEKEFGIDHTEFLNGLATSEKTAQRLQQRFDYINRKFRNPFTPSKYKRDSDDYAEEYMNYFAYERAKKDVLFMQDSFDTTLTHMTEVMESVKADTKLKKVAVSDFNPLFTFQDTQSEIDLLKSEIKAMGPRDRVVSKEGKAYLKQREERLALLETFSNAMENALINSQVYDEEGRLTEQSAIDKATGLEAAAQAYENYLRHLAQVNGDHLFKENVTESFKKLVDFYELDNRAKKLTESVNELMDPGAFSRHSQRLAEVTAQQYANKKALIQQALEEWMDVKEDNDLLQLLHDEGIFFDPEEWKALKEDNVLPSVFYDVKTKDQIKIGTEKYNKALSIIRSVFTELKNVPIPEKQGHPYNAKARNKIKNDTRTYKDLAEQFGFDPNADSTTIPLKEVLQKIIESPYSTAREIALAKKLLSFAKDGQTVTFKSDQKNPGSYDATNQTIIDARYGSSDYENGGHPLEYIILHQEMHRLTQLALQQDATFKNEITKLLELARAHFLKPEVRNAYGAMPFHGIDNVEDFIAEALTNPLFQEFLANVEYNEKTEGTAWTEFVESVLKFLKKVFGRDATNTVLNGAINVITNKIDSMHGITKGAKPIPQAQQQPGAATGTQQPGAAVSATTALSPTTPFDTLNQHPDLMTELIEAYRTENRERQNGGLEPYEEGWETMTDEQIKASGTFRNAFIKRFRRAYLIIKNYNQRTGRTAPSVSTPPPVATPPQQPASQGTPPPPAGTNQGIPLLWTADMKRQFLDLGYTEEERRTLTPAEGWAIINSGLTKEERDFQAAAAQRAQQQDLAEQKERVLKEVDDWIEMATTIEELEIAQEGIAEIFRDPHLRNVSGLTGQMIHEKVEAKKQRLQAEINFDHIEVGETVVLKDAAETKAVVTSKSANQIKLRKFDDASKVYTINRNAVQNRIKYRYSNGVLYGQPQNATPEITPEEAVISNQSQQNSTTLLNDRDAVQEMINAARDNQDTGWLDNINECE